MKATRKEAPEADTGNSATPIDEQCHFIDNEICRMVVHELRHNNWTRCVSIEVEVRDGVVTLHGSVASCAIRDAAERVARHAPGVRTIVNLIAVSIPSIFR